MILPRLHLVTDDAVLADSGFTYLTEQVLAVCGSSAALHVRGHATSGRRLHEVAERLQAMTSGRGSRLLVNDRVDIAMAAGADGVQLGARSLAVADARSLLGAGARIGRSVHGTAEALEAEADGADFALLGTIYDSESHPGRRGAGVALIAATTAQTLLPIVAIGGITPERIAAVAAAGAHGVAVLGGVWRAADPAAAAAEYAAAVHSAWQMEGGTE